MALIVQKYGGTSVGSPERIQAVADKVIQYRNQGHQLVVVVSAMSGETDRLLGLAGSICKRPVPRELDVLLATGEQATIALLSMALQEQGCPARSYTGPQVQILTDSAHNKARIQAIDAARVRQDLAEGADRGALQIRGHDHQLIAEVAQPGCRRKGRAAAPEHVDHQRAAELAELGDDYAVTYIEKEEGFKDKVIREMLARAADAVQSRSSAPSPARWPRPT